MTTTELRTLALALQHRIAGSYTALLPAYTECVSWTLDGADTALPTIAELKAVYNAFNVFEKPDYRLVSEVRALKATTDDAVALVDQIAPFPHTHSYADITSVPATFEPDAHSHVKADVTDFPTVMPPESHTHLKADVTDFPTVMPPESHTHLKADVTDFPTAFPPELHTHVKADVTDFPTTMPPSAHSHAYADITSKPTTFAPSAHSHAVTAYTQYIGNGAASRTLTLSASIMPTLIFVLKGSQMFYWYWITLFGVDIRTANNAIGNAISVTTGTITLNNNVANISGELFTIMAWGNAS